MKITPLEIQQQEFRTVMRGADPKEVRNFLQLMAEEFEELVRHNKALQDELARRMEDLQELKSREDALRETMLTAQKITADLRDAAKKEADIIIARAEVQADKIIRKAHDRMIDIIDQINEFKRQREQFRAQLSGLIESHRKLMDASDEIIGGEARRIEDNVAVLKPQPRAKAQRAADDAGENVGS